MHYRWNYKDINYDYVIDEFTRTLVPPEVRNADYAAAKEQAKAFGDGMDAYLDKLGINENSRLAVEQSMEKLLELLDDISPYILI